MPPVSAMAGITIYSLVSINILTAILTIIVNYCFIAGILSSPSLHNPTNLFIISLSVSDFLVGLIVQPLACILMLTNVSGNPICLMEYLVFISLSIFCGASGLCVPVISLDRYIRMKKLQYYLKYVTKKRACVAIGCIWANALAFAFTPFYGIPQDVFFIMLMVYLLGCSVVMGVAYKSVVRRSVAFSPKARKPNKNYEVVYTRKATLPECEEPKSGQSNRISVQQPVKIKSYTSLTGLDDLKTTSDSHIDDANKIDPRESPLAHAKEQHEEANPAECQILPEERRRLGSTENSRQMRITVTVCLLVAVIIVSWMPTFVFSLIWALDKKRMNTNEMVITLHYIALTFGFACSCVNPLLYCSRIREVRKSASDVFWKTFGCMCCRNP